MIFNNRREELFLADTFFNDFKKSMNIITWLSGKKTYFIAIIGVVINGMYAMGYIAPEFIPTVNIILGFLGLAALRAGISKLNQ